MARYQTKPAANQVIGPYGRKGRTAAKEQARRRGERRQAHLRLKLEEVGEVVEEAVAGGADRVGHGGQQHAVVGVAVGHVGGLAGREGGVPLLEEAEHLQPGKFYKPERKLRCDGVRFGGLL